jgi:hypothetical protein
MPLSLLPLSLLLVCPSGLGAIASVVAAVVVEPRGGAIHRRHRASGSHSSSREFVVVVVASSSSCFPHHTHGLIVNNLKEKSKKYLGLEALLHLEQKRLVPCCQWCGVAIVVVIVSAVVVVEPIMVDVDVRLFRWESGRKLSRPQGRLLLNMMR